MTFPTEERKYIISEICGDWSLHIKGPGTSNNFLFFKSRNNAELVKSILEWEDAHPNEAVPYKPTLTPPNEWVSVETPPTTQGWYHVAILDLKTGKYMVEQDLYSIELAKAHGFEPGFCKANRWEERERIDYWCRFPEPPDRRPPEGEDAK